MDSESEKNIKERWLHLYQNDIHSYHERRELERLTKLKQEKEENEKIKRDIEADRKRRFMRKQSLAQKGQTELNTHFAKKKQFEEFLQKEKINEKNFKGSWDINHEERLQKLKNYMNLLSEKVDLNMNKYIIYNNQLSDKISSGGNSNNNSNRNSPLKNLNYVGSGSEDNYVNANGRVNGLNANSYNLNGGAGNGIINPLSNDNTHAYINYNSNFLQVSNGGGNGNHNFNALEYNILQEQKLNKLISQYHPPRCGVVKNHLNQNVIHYEENNNNNKISSVFHSNQPNTYHPNNNNNIVYNDLNSIKSNTQSPRLDSIKANLLLNSDNQIMLKNRIMNRNDYYKLNNEEKWKQDKYNIANEFQKRGNNKDYMSIVNENSKANKSNIDGLRFNNLVEELKKDHPQLDTKALGNFQLLNPTGEKKHYENFLIENSKQKESPQSRKKLKSEIIANYPNEQKQFLNYNHSPQLEIREKKFTLGNSKLQHNTIVNPEFDYEYNKYINKNLKIAIDNGNNNYIFNKN